MEQLLICGVASENDDKFILLSLLLTVVSVAIGEEKDEKSELLGRVVVDDVVRCSPRSGSSNDALFIVGSRLLLL